MTGDSPPTIDSSKKCNIESDATSLFYAVPVFVGMSRRESTNMLNKTSLKLALH